MLNQSRMPLIEALESYDREKVIPFDVPGHKHGKGLDGFHQFLKHYGMTLDVNSMKSLDIISNPTSVIKEGGDYSFFMIGGTTAAVQAIIMAGVKPGEKIILPRNAHKSALNGLILSGAVPVYIQPTINEKLGIAMGITRESLERALDENPDAKAVFIINPTYYGFTSDLAVLTELAHSRGVLVLADEVLLGPDEQAAPLGYGRFYVELRGAVEATRYELPLPPPGSALLAAPLLYARGLSFSAVALLGLAEGQFPQREIEDPLLNEADRRTMRAAGLPLESRLQGDEASLFYEAVTRARRHLLLTRSFLADDGQAWERSFACGPRTRCPPKRSPRRRRRSLPPPWAGPAAPLPCRAGSGCWPPPRWCAAGKGATPPGAPGRAT